MRFAVHEVAPPAADLADDHTHRGVVEHDQRRDLLHAAQNKHSDRAADDTAVDRQTALPDVEHGDGVITVQIPIEHAVVKPRAHNADGNRPQHEIQHVVLREPERFRPVDHVKNRQQKAAGNDDTVPVNLFSEDRKGNGARVYRDAKVRKRNR